jgi:hypothetical protein
MGFQYVGKEVNVSYVKARHMFTDEAIHEDEISRVRAYAQV